MPDAFPLSKRRLYKRDDRPSDVAEPADDDEDIRMRNAQLLRENTRLRRRIDRLAKKYAELSATHSALQKERVDAKNRMNQREANLSAGYELFKSFVDRGDRAVILIDAAYTIRYVNRSAAVAVQLPDPYIIVGRRIFDFFPYKESLKVKERIDKAFLSGEKEKIKGVSFQNLKGAFFRLKIKMTRVRYQDKPSIKLVLK